MVINLPEDDYPRDGEDTREEIENGFLRHTKRVDSHFYRTPFRNIEAP